MPTPIAYLFCCQRMDKAKAQQRKGVRGGGVNTEKLSPLEGYGVTGFGDKLWSGCFSWLPTNLAAHTPVYSHREDGLRKRGDRSQATESLKDPTEMSVMVDRG